MFQKKMQITSIETCLKKKEKQKKKYQRNRYRNMKKKQAKRVLKK